MLKIYNLYIHIPFCERKCNYCDFTSFCDIKEQDTYINYLIKELKKYYDKSYKFKTIYFGGGTPSLLSIENFKKIFNELDFDENTEITVEVNPNSVDLNKLKKMRSIGINRLSIGIQSFNDENLKLLGRLHNKQKAIDCFNYARESGFENISIDLMFSLPNQTLYDLKKDLEEILVLNPEHFSIYSLIWEEGTKFFDYLEKGIYKETDNFLETEMYEEIISFAKKYNYVHYEISNFAKNNFESKHNNNYWLNKHYLGIGLSAAGYINNTRYTNVDNFSDYYRLLDRNEFPISDKELLSKNDTIKYRYLGGLRILNKYTLIDDKDLLKAIELKEKNFIEILNNSMKLTKKGLLFYNDVIMKFL